MPPTPLYLSDSLKPAYALRFTWTGWLSRGGTWRAMLPSLWTELAALWETDGMRPLEWSSTADEVQVCFSTNPHVSPILVAQRAKGRLQHALRQADCPVQFQRKTAVRSVGENTTEAVERYIASQVERSAYIDERYREFLRTLIVKNESVDLGQPKPSLSGRYWYNLHLVLVAAERVSVGDSSVLLKQRDAAIAIAARKGYAISSLSVMPDHMHIALGGAIGQAPDEIALAFMNNLAYALGQKPIWRAGYYVGTFSDYDMGAIRRRVMERSAEQ